MNANVVRKPEQIRLITECRRSGLSDYQWCREQGINPGTFYNWVSKLRKAGYTIPDSESKVCGTSVRQEVVKLDLVTHEMPAPDMATQNTSHLVSASIPCIAAEIECGNIKIRLFNGADDIEMKQLNEDPNGHSIYLFCGRRCDRIKVLLREPDGYVLLYKRLDVVHGKYRWPRNSSEVRPITWQQFDWLMSGLEVEQPKALWTA